ncbi:predicted protein [Candida tropicalis MYA-3404]|uniref:Uncharacterized protein n=1 Tax=Candida tropicalis (strain ATCC MYA-3404 / T1) TaxID=294747 RepID=C5MH38_CANTT|nr:predicted protein [Candida tropicalis MYA-3404]EER30941.1 predicted protein [Candida tropicalis MYA-3404]KAG4404500.1 hypothetical protein JTP64_006253 [Candida tropicalis]
MTGGWNPWMVIPNSFAISGSTCSKLFSMDVSSSADLNDSSLEDVGELTEILLGVDFLDDDFDFGLEILELDERDFTDFCLDGVIIVELESSLVVSSCLRNFSYNSVSSSSPSSSFFLTWDFLTLDGVSLCFSFFAELIVRFLTRLSFSSSGCFLFLAEEEAEAEGDGDWNTFSLLNEVSFFCSGLRVFSSLTKRDSSSSSSFCASTDLVVLDFVFLAFPDVFLTCNTESSKSNKLFNSEFPLLLFLVARTEPVSSSVSPISGLLVLLDVLLLVEVFNFEAGFLALVLATSRVGSFLSSDSTSGVLFFDLVFFLFVVDDTLGSSEAFTNPSSLEFLTFSLYFLSNFFAFGAISELNTSINDDLVAEEEYLTSCSFKIFLN